MNEITAIQMPLSNTVRIPTATYTINRRQDTTVSVQPPFHGAYNRQEAASKEEGRLLLLSCSVYCLLLIAAIILYGAPGGDHR